MDIIALIILLAVVQLLAFGMNAGFSRQKYGVDAPATTGNAEWERRYRVHQNTMEHMVAFVPAIYFCATYANIKLAIVAGCIYLIGRCLYAYTYIKEPKTRALGMMLSFLPIAVMILAALGGVVINRLG